MCYAPLSESINTINIQRIETNGEKNERLKKLKFIAKQQIRQMEKDEHKRIKGKPICVTCVGAVMEDNNTIMYGDMHREQVDTIWPDADLSCLDNATVEEIRKRNADEMPNAVVAWRIASPSENPFSPLSWKLKSEVRTK